VYLPLVSPVLQKNYRAMNFCGKEREKNEQKRVQKYCYYYYYYYYYYCCYYYCSYC
jgi:hypothetical protein